MATSALLLDQIDEKAEESALEAARAHLDGCSVADTADAICSALLVWPPPPSPPLQAADEGGTNLQSVSVGRRERCRLVSYAAIMHGSALLPHLPAIARMIVPLLGDEDELVSEELLRMIGNLSRYVLATHGTGDAAQGGDALMSLVGPFIGVAVGENNASQTTARRARASLIAVHRVFLELPPELLHAETMLPAALALLNVVKHAAGGAPPAEALPPLSRAVQVVGVHLDEPSVHRLVQCGVACLRAEGPSTSRRGAIELLRTLAPMLRVRRAEEEFARSLLAWVADEIALLPEAARRQLSVRDLEAAYGEPPSQPARERPAAATVTTADAVAAALAAAAESDAIPLAHCRPAVSSSTTSASHRAAATQQREGDMMPLPSKGSTSAKPPQASPPQRGAVAPLPDSDVELLERMARLEKELGEIPMLEETSNAAPPVYASRKPHVPQQPSMLRAPQRPARAITPPPARVGGGYDLTQAAPHPAMPWRQPRRGQRRQFAITPGSLAFRSQLKRDKTEQARRRRQDVAVEIFAPPPRPPSVQQSHVHTVGFTSMPIGISDDTSRAGRGVDDEPPAAEVDVAPASPIKAHSYHSDLSSRAQAVNVVQNEQAAKGKSVQVMRGGAAASQEDVLAQLRDQMRSDLQFEAGSAPDAALHESSSSSRVPLASLREHSAGNVAAASSDVKRDALAALLSMRTKEIESTHNQRCEQASRQLLLTYQQEVARLQATLVRQLNELGVTTERNIEAELQAFMQLGLPAIQHILSDSSAALAGKGAASAAFASRVSHQASHK